MSYADTILETDGLLACWPFDEASGTTFADALGSDDLTIAGGVTLGGAGLAEGLAGSADFILASSGRAHRASPFLDADISVECWVRPDDTGAADTAIWSNGSGPDDVGYALILDGARLKVLIHGISYRDTAHDLTQGQVYHIVVTRASAFATTKVYVDGEEVYEENTPAHNAISGGFSVGGDRDGAGRNFDGAISDVSVYGRILTAEEVAEHFDAGQAVEGASGDDETRRATWEVNLYDRHYTGPRPYVTKPVLDGEGNQEVDPNGRLVWNTGPGADEHYDAGACFRNARDYAVVYGLTPTDWSPQIQAADVMWRDGWIFKYDSGNAGNGFRIGQPAGYHHFTHGLARGWLEDGDAASLEALVLMHPATFGLTEGQYKGQREWPYWQREEAFRLMGAVDRYNCGLGFHESTNWHVDCLLGFIDHFTKPWDQRYGVFIRPFMWGLILRSLVYYWFTFRDSEDTEIQDRRALIPTAIEESVSHIMTYAWWPEGETVPIFGSGDLWDHGCIKYIYPSGDVGSHAPITGLTVQTKESETVFTGDGSLSAVDDFYKNCIVFGGWVSSYDGAAKRFTINNTGVGSVATFNVGDPFDISPQGGDNGEGGYATDAGIHVCNMLVSPGAAFAYWHRKTILGDAAGAAQFRTYHQMLLDGSRQAWLYNFAQKEYNETQVWGPLGFGYRDAGDAGEDTQFELLSAPAAPTVAGAASFTLAATAAAVLAGSSGLPQTRAASAILVLGATASERSAFARPAAASLTLAAVASAALEGVPATYTRPASAALVLTATASERGALSLAASATFTLAATAAFSQGVATQPPGGYIGRYQVGQEVPFLVQCRDARGAPALPSAPPTARVYRDGAFVRAIELALDDDPEAVGRFRGVLTLGDGDAPGRHAVVYLYGVGVDVVVGSDTFDVAGGGDPQGPALSVAVIARPDADAVLAHLGSGRLAMGRVPYLDEGI